MRRRRSRRTFWVSLCLLLLGVGGVITLAACLAQPNAERPKPREGAHEPVEPVEPGEPGEPGGIGPRPGQPLRVAGLPKGVETRPQARRLKVGGAGGHWIVINPDGSSVLEGPDGQRTPLAGVGELNPPVDVIRKVEERLKPPVPPKKEVGQLVICDEGAVDVPTDAVITFVGKDKVVTHDPSGASVTYYVNGRVERRGKAERGREEAASNPKKE